MKGVEDREGVLTPPDVGAAEPSSAIDRPTNKRKTLARSHYQRSVMKH